MLSIHVAVLVTRTQMETSNQHILGTILLFKPLTKLRKGPIKIFDPGCKHLYN